MQVSSEIEPAWLGSTADIRSEQLQPVNSLQLIVAVAVMLMAFVRLAPPVDALERGLSLRGLLEFGLLLVALSLLAIYLKKQGAFSFDLKSPAFLVVSVFCWWSLFSAIWSPNPILTIAKAGELWCISLAALMISTLALRSRFTEGRLETIFAIAMVLVIGGLLLINLQIWGKVLPNTGDASLPLELFGEELSERPRLIMAYQHALLTADLLAIAIICLLVSDLGRFLKVILLAGLFALFWLTDARAALVGLIVSISALGILKLRRNSLRAIVVMMTLSLAVGVLLVLQDRLPTVLKPLLSDDMYTLNSRTELWSKVMDHILAQPILGTGFFASRYLLIKDFSWAGHAHNSFFEVQLTTGLIGLMLLGLFLVLVCREILLTKNGLLLGITIYCLIQGMVNPLLFNPGFAMFALMLALLSAALKRSSTEGIRNR